MGHTIIGLSAPPFIESEMGSALDWAEYLNNVSSPIEQRPAILVIPFADVDDPALPCRS